MEAESPEKIAQKAKNRRLMMKLILSPIAMLVFVFAVLVPLYGLLCTVVGQQTNPNNPDVVADAGGPTGRFVDVFFEGRVHDGLPVSFTVDHPSMHVEVGVDNTNVFRVVNLSDHEVRLRPIHLVNPQHAAQHFGMKVCFCFNDQTIEAHGKREFPVVFAFGPGMDGRVTDVTIGYSLLALRDGESPAEAQVRAHTSTENEGTIVTPRFATEPRR
jgi:cytochrome c oxidase assembly protein subunit 11